MTAIDITNGFRPRPVWQDLVAALAAGWRTLLYRRKERRAIVAISRLSTRLIRDVGVDPAQICEPLDRNWDELHPVAFRILLPGDLRG